MLLKRFKHKNFDYIPRYYDPAKDPEIRRRDRYHFKTNVRRGKRPSMGRLLLWLAAAIIAYMLLAG